MFEIFTSISTSSHAPCGAVERFRSIGSFKGQMVSVSCEIMVGRCSHGYLSRNLGKFFRRDEGFRLTGQQNIIWPMWAVGRWFSVGALIAVMFAMAALAPGALTAESSPGPAKPPLAAIPLTDVASEAESVTFALRDIQSDLSFDRSTKAIADQLPALTREIDGRLVESRKILGQNPSIEMLRRRCRWSCRDTQRLRRHCRTPLPEWCRGSRQACLNTASSRRLAEAPPP